MIMKIMKENEIMKWNEIKSNNNNDNNVIMMK